LVTLNGERREGNRMIMLTREELEHLCGYLDNSPGNCEICAIILEKIKAYLKSLIASDGTSIEEIRRELE
jgi:hypothetical protein